MIYNIKLYIGGNPMDLKQLQYFLAMVECQSLSKAAEKLHLAQPALSRQLKQMEEEFGVSLIERTTRSFQMTEAGKTLAHRGAQILEMADTLKQEMADLGLGKIGTIRIGTIGSEMELMLPQFMATFSNVYPNASFKCFEGSSVEVLEQLRHGLIDIGVVRSPVDVSPFKYIQLPVQPMVAAHIKEQPWMKNEQRLTWEVLQEDRLIAHHRYLEDIKNGCHRFGFEPKFAVTAEDTRSLLLMASVGMGTVIVQKDWLKMVPAAFFYKEIDAKELETQTVILWHKDRYIPEIAKSFVKSIEEALR